LCDDGLQHYALQRDIEIAIVDTSRFTENNFLLPAGPLREASSRLDTVDFIVYHGARPSPHGLQMQLQAGLFYQLTQRRQEQASYFVKRNCHAITGIGNPTRFFNCLKQMGIACQTTLFPDHHIFSVTDLPSSDIIFVTEKDAVKLTSLKDDRIWVLPVTAQVEPDLVNLLLTKLKHKK
jgi:tetraacyldisaccharide 4'-kinase